MRVITAIGEQGLSLPDGREVVMRPSLYAMTQLGTPEEIVEKFAALHRPPTFVQSMPFDTPGAAEAANRINLRLMREHWRDMLFLSWEVMQACCDDSLTPFIGEPGVRYGSYRLGLVPPEAMLLMARNLMQHGVIGPMPKMAPEQAVEVKRDKAKYTKGFEAINFVSKAVAHLGLSEKEAWNMTLTGFAAHWQAKFGEQKEARHSEEHDDTMAWLAKVNEIRNRRQ